MCWNDDGIREWKEENAAEMRKIVMEKRKWFWKAKQRRVTWKSRKLTLKRRKWRWKCYINIWGFEDPSKKLLLNVEVEIKTGDQRKQTTGSLRKVHQKGRRLLIMLGKVIIKDTVRKWVFNNLNKGRSIDDKTEGSAVG